MIFHNVSLIKNEELYFYNLKGLRNHLMKFISNIKSHSQLVALIRMMPKVN